MTDRERIIESIHEGRLFDFIGTHGHELRKDDLCNLVKELDYALNKSVNGHDKPYSILIDELEERWDMENGKEKEDEEQ